MGCSTRRVERLSFERRLRDPRRPKSERGFGKNLSQTVWSARSVQSEARRVPRCVATGLGGAMQSKSLFFRFILLGVFCLVCTGVSRAQSDRGTIAGTVLDSSGGVVVNAQVVAKGSDTSPEYTAVTGPTGGYRMPEVKIGVYSVTVTAAGFKVETKTGVQVQVNTVSTLDYSLTAGDVKETVTVSADAPSLQSESSDIGTIVGRKQIEDLPLALAATG